MTCRIFKMHAYLKEPVKHLLLIMEVIHWKTYGAVFIQLQGKGVATKWFGKDMRFGFFSFIFFFFSEFIFILILSLKCRDKVKNWEIIDLAPVGKWASARTVMFVKSLNHFVP